eukprot:TRINITY_DN184_c1_g1_i1.p1 TRINITY_DN184_c1_g1~~TRINITY_DN184_c1_g1_i1.p1  ORF type:complete len:350 (+),score=95.45 TRINITY_DN184_c1_g1_i1:57-1052(+)
MSALNTMSALTEFEQAIIDEVNLARTRPRDYAAHIHNVMKRNPDAIASYEELFNVLRVRSSVGEVGISKGLSVAARKRAEAVSTRVRVYDQADLLARASRYGKVEDPGSLKEVVWTGRTGSDIRKLVLTILADETNPNRSRRTALLSASSGVCGVAISGSVITIILCKAFHEAPPVSVDVHATHGVGNYGGKYIFSSHIPEEPTRAVRQVLTPPHMHTGHVQTSSTYRMPTSPSTPRLNDYNDIKKILPQSGPLSGGLSGLSKTIPPPVQPPAPARVAAPPAETGQRIVGLENLKTTLASGNGESNYVGFNAKLRSRIVGWLKDVEVPVMA